MRKTLRMVATILTGLFLTGTVPTMAGGPLVYYGNLVNEAGLAYNNTYAIDTDQQTQINQMSAAAVYSSATISTATFTDGTTSTGSVTVASNSSFSAVKATDNITLGSTSALAATKATDSLTVVSTTNLVGAQIYFNGFTLIGGSDWAVSTTTGTAIAIKNALSNFGVITVSTSGSGTVVSATATLAGIGGNAFTLRSSTVAMTVASAHFTGGTPQALDNAILTVNGITYRNGYSWASQDTSSGTASSIAAFLSTLPGIAASTGGASALVVFATATTAGLAGSSFTLASSTPSAMTVASANFAGGRDAAAVTINGTTLTSGVDWTSGSTSTATAKAISDAIMASTALNTLIRSTWTAQGVVTATSTVASSTVNYTASDNTTSLTTVGFTGGTATAISVANDTITSAANGFTTALPVLYTKTAGTTPTGLTVGTTYYPILVDANTFKLSDTSTGAVAGSPVVNITAQTGTGGGTFVLTPLGITGTPSFKWQQSNDNTNWFDMSVTSVTFASPYTASSTFWDFAQVNARYVRANVIAPTRGGFRLTVTLNAKN